MHVYVRVRVCTHKWKPDVKDTCFPQLLSTVCFFFNMHGGCTHVHMCVGVHVMQCVCAMYLCMQRLEVGILVFLDHFPPYALIWFSHLNPKLANRLVWLASLLSSASVSNSQALA